jgi:hypothetical protein
VLVWTFNGNEVDKTRLDVDELLLVVFALDGLIDKEELAWLLAIGTIAGVVLKIDGPSLCCLAFSVGCFLVDSLFC